MIPWYELVISHIIITDIFVVYLNQYGKWKVSNCHHQQSW
jgi:hypothetical protein